VLENYYGIRSEDFWRALKLFDKLKCEFEVKTMEEQGIKDTLFGL
jgi:hypothetical protein